MRAQTTVLVLAAAVLATPLAGAESEDFRWAGRLKPGQTIEVKGVNGSIEAAAASGDEVSVLAEKSARRDDPSEVEIAVVEHAGGVTICAVYPASRWSLKANRCEPGEAGSLGADRNDVEVEFTVQVPAGVHFAGRTVNGGITAEGLGGDVLANTVNGSVRASGSGVVRGETVNGSLFARLGRADWKGDLSYSTVNGSITVELPEDANAEVSASTVNGGIEADFPLAIKGKWGPKSARGTLGSGGRSLDLETVNGAIKLRKRL